MERLTVDTDLMFCDIAQCSSIQGGSNCEDGYCDQRRVYERLREYERVGLEPEEIDQICRAAKTMVFETIGDFVRYSIANFDALRVYHSIGPATEFRALKEAEQKRRETWHSAVTSPPCQYGLYWGKKDSTNSMWAVRYKSGVWTLSAHPDTKMPIKEWAYWDTFTEGESHDN